MNPRKKSTQKGPLMPKDPLFWEYPKELDLSTAEGEAWIVDRAKDAATLLTSDPQTVPAAFLYTMIHPGTLIPYDKPAIGMIDVPFDNDDDRELVAHLIPYYVTRTRAMAVIFIARGFMIPQALQEADGIRPSGHPQRQRFAMLIVAHRRITGNHARYFNAPIREVGRGFLVGPFREEGEPGTSTGRFVEIMPDLERN